MKKINLRLLRLLQGRPGSWCYPEKIIEELKLSRKKLLSDIAAIRDHGFTVNENPHLGYMLEDGLYPLVADVITDGLKTRIIGRKVRVFESVTSTMDHARELAERGEHENGTVVLAEEQSAGRGRMGRTWRSNKGKDLLFSVVLVCGEDTVPSLITVSASLALAEFFRGKAKLNARIRFPNDVVVGKKKLAGILVERVRAGAYVLGAGINVNEAEPPVAGATSLRAEKKKTFDRNVLARHVLTVLDEWYGKVLERKLDDIDGALRRLSLLLGKSATVIQKGKRFTGIVVHLSALNGLTLATPDGKRLTFKAEQVRLAH
jgi:BirA family biotin operon repressor/biotin-[acetyl-CoA-carboxylase] ligase